MSDDMNNVNEKNEKEVTLECEYCGGEFTRTEAELQEYSEILSVDSSLRPDDFFDKTRFCDINCQEAFVDERRDDPDDEDNDTDDDEDDYEYDDEDEDIDNEDEDDEDNEDEVKDEEEENEEAEQEWS